MKPSGMMPFTINTETKLMTFRIKMSELLLTEWLTATKKQMFPFNFAQALNREDGGISLN